MNQPVSFQVLRGGLSEDASTSKKEFISAYTTDTRLMGVVGLVLHWYLPQNTSKKHFFQFFYLDAEEYGFDTYRSVLASDLDDEPLAAVEELRSTEQALMGGLGGKKVSLTEREARAVIQYYVDFSLSRKLPLPDGIEEYQFLLGPRITLGSAESYALMKKQCPAFTSEFQIINYFLMRCFGRDFSAAKFLTKHYVRTDLFPEHKAATLMQNTIDEAAGTSGSHTSYHATDSDKTFGTFDTQKKYLCESLIEYDSKYFLLVTQVTLEHLKVVKYERISSFRISASEASMITDRPEFVTVFDCPPQYAESALTFTDRLENSMLTEHENGRLFMIFYPHNNHVSKRVFRLSDDVFGVFYLADNGQILLSSGSRSNLRTLERELMASGVGSVVTPLSRYQFQEPVLYDFVNSICEDFEEFVDMISELEPVELDSDNVSEDRSEDHSGDAPDGPSEP